MARILIIDDEEMLTSTLNMILREAGHETATAPNGRVGLEKYRAQPDFDIAISDIIMPEVDGIGLIQSLRELSLDLGIIAISGGGRTKNYDLLRMALKLGANDVVRKPFSTEDILSAVNKCLAEKQRG